jgi:hypothetical protein
MCLALAGACVCTAAAKAQYSIDPEIVSVGCECVAGEVQLQKPMNNGRINVRASNGLNAKR